jgi:hypothetical protein
MRLKFTILDVTWDRQLVRKHPYGRVSPTLNVWFALTLETVIGPFFFDQDIITRNSLIDVLEKYVLLQLKTTTILFVK